MLIKESFQRRLFIWLNYIILTITGLVCLMPFINLLAVSFSSQHAINSGKVSFWPVEFTTKSYEFVINNPIFIKALFNTLIRVFLGVTVNMILTVLVAYPLSKSKNELRSRGFYSWFFLITILFNGGLIPWYMAVKYTGLIDSVWALVLPGALPVFNMIVLLNFFRGLPKELEEAAFLDGAGHFTTLWKIFLPLSKPSLATVGLFCIVGHWNSWFDGLILMNNPMHYPLQSYLQTVIINPETYFRNAVNLSSDTQSLLNYINVRSTKTAQIFISTIPVLVAYPLLQKYFTTGLVMGSVKG